MKIQINQSKVPSLYSSNNQLIEDFYYEKIDDNIDNIIYELKNYIGNNYIITGYRGAGKTTFIKFIEEKVSNNCNLFVFVDYPISKGYYTLLKKIIRSLYISLDENYLINHDIKKKLKYEMEELYISTFTEIKRDFTSTVSNKKTDAVISEINIVNLILSVISIILILLYIFNSFFGIDTNILLIGIILNTIVLGIKNIKQFFKITISSKKISSDDNKSSLNIKKYYDDDISELHLKNIIKSFNKKGIKITFIIDELDKIEEEEEVNKVINSIKPLLLSGISNFIIISGQATLYQIYNGKTESDKVINSLFSREIHIPLFSKAYFHRIVKNIVVSNNNIKIDDTILADFVNHLILKSNKNIRKFIINLKNSISWSEEKNIAFITLNKNKIYQNESKILEIIDLIETKNIQYQYLGIRDYLINQLFIWTNKIYIKGEIEFKLDDIISEKEQHPFLSQYNENITLIGEDFFKHLVGKKILTKSGDSYKLNIEVESNPNNLNVHSVENIFFDLYRNFEKIVIELQSFYNIKSKILNKNSFSFLKEKFNLDISNEIKTLRNKIVHGEKTSEEDFISISTYVRDLPGIISNIIEGYTYNILEEYFEKFNYKSHLKNNYGKILDDTSAKNYDFKYTRDSIVINIDVKYNNFEISNQLDKLLDNEYYIFIFHYDYKKYNGYEKIQNLNKIIKNKGLDGNVFFINNSEDRWVINKSTTTTYLNKYLAIIEKIDNPISITKNNFITGYNKIDNKISIYPKEIALVASHPIELSSNLLLNIFIKNFMNGTIGLYVSNNIVKERMFEKIKHITEELFLICSDDKELNEIIEVFIDKMLFNIVKPEDIIEHISSDTEFILIDNVQTYCSSTKEYDLFLKIIKQIGVKYNLPIILSSHVPLNKISSRHNKRPIESDISNYSSNLFNLSNIILTLYKEEYYDEFTEKKRVIEININKGLNKNNNSPIELLDDNGHYYEVE